MELESDAFERGGSLPLRYTHEGENDSPPLTWSDVPPEARELALVFENVSEPWVQWVVYGIPPDLAGLPEGFQHEAEPEVPAKVVQGTNSRGNVGYDGPLGAEGRRYRYVFRLYALDERLDAPPALDREALGRAMADHVIQEAELEATYERPRG